MECVKIDTLCSGEIDCDDFKAKLLCHKDKPAIVNVNIGNFLLLSHSLMLSPCLLWLSHSNISGTTVKGAVDDLDLVIKKIEEAGFSNDRFYIHCDGALFGLMLPFVKRVSFETKLIHSNIITKEYSTHHSKEIITTKTNKKEDLNHQDISSVHYIKIH